MRALVSMIVIALLSSSAMAVQFTGVQTTANTWTYTLTYDPLDNYSVCQSNTTITISGLSGVTAAGIPTSTDHPTGADQLSWTAQVLNGGTTVVWTKAGGGTGNRDEAYRVYGFTITAPGVKSGTASMATSGFVRDTDCPAAVRDIGHSVAGPTGYQSDYRVLPVVGSTAGAQGAQFRTAVQLYNPRLDETLTGQITYHPQGMSGSGSDPILSYDIPPGQTVHIPDLLPAMGISAGGVGSADITPGDTFFLPIVSARIFNDAGSAGTSGLVESDLAPGDALQKGVTAALIAPNDMVKFRLNIGIRTLQQGAAMTITVRNKNGAVVKTTSKSYPATYFTQVGSSALLDGYVLTGGETINFFITSGSAFIYGATTDNVTNDPAMAFARPTT